VTDTTSDKVYRVDVTGRASVFVQDERLASPVGDGLNGIVWHPAGFLLGVRYDTGELFRITARGVDRIKPVRLERPLTGGDGLVLRRDGSLVVVTNTLGQANDGTVLTVRSDDGWRSARVVRGVVPWADPVPTTAADSPYGTYVVSGRLDVLITGATSDRFTLRRL
jgi:hypothetical protein